jgi:hypothetical protein
MQQGPVLNRLNGIGRVGSLQFFTSMGPVVDHGPMKNFIAAICLFVSIPGGCAEACRGGENTPKDSLESAFKGASMVFIGEVVSVLVREKKDVLATFKILKSWKGSKSGTVSIPVQTGRSCDLGRYVEIGSKWFVLIDAKAKPEAKTEITISTQSHSRRLFELKEEEAIVIEVEKLK